MTKIVKNRIETGNGIAKRPRTNYIPFMDADPDRILVSMIEFKDNIYVATQKGVYILKKDKFERLEFVKRNGRVEVS